MTQLTRTEMDARRTRCLVSSYRRLAFVPCAECGSERLFSDRNICHSCRTKGWLSPAQVKEKVKQLKDIWKIALAEQRWSDPDVLNECLVQWFKTIDSVFVDEAYAEMLNKGV